MRPKKSIAYLALAAKLKQKVKENIRMYRKLQHCQNRDTWMEDQLFISDKFEFKCYDYLYFAILNSLRLAVNFFILVMFFIDFGRLFHNLAPLFLKVLSPQVFDNLYIR